MNKTVSKLMKKVVGASMVLTLLVGQSVIVNALSVGVNITPTTQTELTQYQSMTLDQLKAAAKPMPEGHYQVVTTKFGNEKTENYYSPIPEDGGIYYLENDILGSKYIDYYKFLYINASPSEPGIVQYHIFTWEAVNNVLDNKSSVPLVGNEGNQDLYNQLRGSASSSNNGSSQTPSNPSNNDNSNSGNGNSGNSSNPSNSKHYKEKRLSGLSRIETAGKIAEELYSGTVGSVVLATGSDFPDALAGSVLASQFNAPILLTGTSSVDTAPTIDYIKNHLDKSGTIYVLGGQGVINNSLIDNLNSLGYSHIERLGGSNRFDTCSLINNKLNSAKGTPIILATGNDYPDALSISSIADANSFPIVLTNKDSLPSEVTTLIQNIKPSLIYVVGGTGAISDNVLSQVKALTGLTDSNMVRISGSDRYETSLNIAKHFNFTGNTVTFATGKDFPDALAGSVLAAKLQAPILLVGDDVASQIQYMNNQNFTNQIIFGGTGAIGSSLESTLAN